MVTSAARPSAPSAAAGKLVAIEKKITVPPAAVARIAPCSQPGTSTHTTVTVAGAPSAATTADDTATGSRASATATWSATPAASSVARSASDTTTPTVRAPASRAAVNASDPLLPAPPSTATVTGPAAACCRTTRSVNAGAPHTSNTASASSGARSSGSTATTERPNRIACPAAGTCSLSPSQPARPSVTASGVRVSDTSVATRSPAFTGNGDCGPTSSTTPISIPPEPVTGLCILPRVPMISSTSARTAVPSPPCLPASCRMLAASRFSRSSRIRTSSGPISGRASSRHAACGSTPCGSSTRDRPTGNVMPTILTRNRLPFGRPTVNPPELRLLDRRFSSIVDPDHSPTPGGPVDRAEERRGHRGRAAVQLPAPHPDRARLDPLPRLAQRHHQPVGVRPVAARQLRQERPTAARPHGRPARRPLLRRPRNRHAASRHHVDAGAAADAQHHGARQNARYGVVLRRPHPALHDPRRHRPPPPQAVTPPLHPRLPARARHVGRRGPHPPLPDQGPRRAAQHLPPVLRPLHPHGPGRQQHPDRGQAPSELEAGRSVRRASPVLERAPGRTGRRGQRRRRGQRPLEAARELSDGASVRADGARHPPRHQGADGPPPALAAGRRRRGPQ